MADFTKLNGYTVKDPNAIHTYDTVADLKADTKLKAGNHAQTKGYATAGDDGHATYIIVDDNTLVDDGGSVHNLANGFKAVLLIENEINVKQFGAKGDNTTDDTNAIINALSMNVPLYFPKGRYILKQSVTISNKIVRGAGQFNTFIKATNDIEGNVVTIGSDHVKIADLTIESPDYDYEDVGTTNTNTAIYINDYHHLTFENVRVVGFNYGLYCRRAWCISCYDVIVLCCNTGIYGIDEFNNCLFERCIVDNNTVGFHFQGGYGNVFNACDFEKNDDGVQTWSRGDLAFFGCYFENNTGSCLNIHWGNYPITAITLDNCTFWANNTCDGLIKYHAKPETPIVLRDCTFRNNETLESGTIPIFIKQDNTQCLPHIIGGDIGASFSIIEDAYINNLKPTKLVETDWITLENNVAINDFAVYEENKHIYGTLTFTVTGGVQSASTTLGVLKDKYKPDTAVNTYAVLSADRWQQTTSNLCYLYISSTSIACRNGDGTSTVIKAKIDYVRK